MVCGILMYLHSTMNDVRFLFIDVFDVEIISVWFLDATVVFNTYCHPAKQPSFSPKDKKLVLHDHMGIY